MITVDTVRIFNKKTEYPESLLKEFGYIEDIASADIAAAKTKGYRVFNDSYPTLKEWYENLMIIPSKERVNNLLFIDTETNRLNGYIVSIAMIEYDLKNQKIVDKFYVEVNPQEQIEEEAASVHKITEDKIKDAPTFEEIEKEVSKRIEKSDLIVAFNAIYDIGVLIREYERLGKKMPEFYFLDLMTKLKTIVNAKTTNNRLKNATLEEAATFFGIASAENELHNSLYDTEILLLVFEKALQKIMSQN